MVPRHPVYVFIVTLGGTAFALGNPAAVRSARLTVRQDATSSESSWSYPTPDTPATSVAPVMPSSSSPVLSSAPAVLASSSPISGFTSLADPVVASSAIIALPTSTSPPVQSFTLSPPSTTSLIHITALPPAGSSSSNRLTTHSKSPFSIVYLAPVFAFVGAALGSVLAWFLYRICTRGCRRRAREDILEPGPRYVPPPENMMENVRGQPSYAVSRDLLTPSEPSSHGPAFAHSPSRDSWMIHSSDSSRHIPPPRASVPGASASTWSSSEHRSSGDDIPLLAPGASSAVSTPVRPQTSAHPSAPFAQLRSPDPPSLFGDADDDITPYELLRHTSIRRNILDRLKRGSLRRSGSPSQASAMSADQGSTGGQPIKRATRRHGHSRRDSDLTIDQLVDSSQSRSSGTIPSRESSIRRNAATNSSSYTGTGFRIIEEDPEADARAREQAEQSRPRKDGATTSWNLPWALSPDKRAEDDRYTRLPPRRAAVDRRNALSVTSHGPRTPAPPLSRVDSSVLPLSPPRITSPPLESQLFFGPVVTPASVADPIAPASRGSSTSCRPSVGTSERPDAGRMKRLRKEPPLLPFPSTPGSSPYRTRLEKTQPYKATLLETTDTAGNHASPYPPPSSSHGGAQRRRFERPNVQTTPHDKIDQIIAQSWSHREMGASRGSSAQPIRSIDMREAMTGTGIEQRLHALHVQEDIALRDSDR
ncbi:hypothetical protein OBBRIDRAFT_456257 [Obba rivulosa]|uniref:Uncharacterized protein n=1 Tax=Obba rivulosa TaxID=1052685 RepID=A0A8E2DM70_9APHY|nr:hypothetical protein OBBRIDRAFT_456257 [Obba rivulosa]